MKPTLFGKYTLIDELGHGRTSDVFLAVPDAAAGIAADVVVLKQPREPRGEDLQLPADATLACQLHHPNIAETYEVSTTEGAPYWASERVHGKPLDELLSAAAHSGGLPIQLRLWIAAAVLRALDYAHNLKDQAGAASPVVHGDVRPHNVFIGYAGDVKLLDFGMSRRVANGGDMAPADVFRAPESALGTQDARSDVYAAGRLLAALSGSAASLEPEATRESWSLLEAPIRAVYERATRDDPSTRHPSAMELLSEVEALLQYGLEREPAQPAATSTVLAELMQQLFASERENEEARLAQLRAAPIEAEFAVTEASPTQEDSTIALDDAVASLTEPSPSQEDSTLAIALDEAKLTEPIELIEDDDTNSDSMLSEPPSRPSMPPPPLPKPHAQVERAGFDKGTGYALLIILLASMALIGTRL